MTLTSQDKENLKKELGITLSEAPEVIKMVVFGCELIQLLTVTGHSCRRSGPCPR
jgi:hypothetical protein